jgi:uncharacterized small protein (DUF1192 family)
VSRIALIQARITARTDAKGKALPGYTRNVAALKAELARLQAEETLAANPKNPAP